MSKHKRSKWKFSPARKHRPSANPLPVPEEEAAETAAPAEEEIPAVEAAVVAAAIEEAEIPAEAAEAVEEAEAEIPEEAVPEPETAVPEEIPVEEIQAEKPDRFAETFGAVPLYAPETPDYYFDDDDLLEKAFSEGAGSEYAEEEFREEPTEEDFEEEEFFGEEAEAAAAVSLYEMGLKSGKRKKKKGSGKNKKGGKKADKESGKRIVKIGDLAVGDGTPRICVPITGRTKEEIAAQAAQTAAAAPDMVEWRVDYLEEAAGKSDIVDILVNMRHVLGEIPILFTYRTEGEGGQGRVGWSHYAELLEWAACRPEIDAIDVEATGLDVDTEGLIKVIHGRGTPVISSVHYCWEMPDKKEWKEAVRFLKQSGGDILKLAVTPRNEEDVLELMKRTLKLSKKLDQPLITVAMGNVGKLSRVSGRLTGSAVTFGSVVEESAPGQIPASELREILRQV